MLCLATPRKNFWITEEIAGGKLRRIITRSTPEKALMPPRRIFFLSIFTIQNVSRVMILEESVEEILAVRFWFQVKEGN